VTGPPATRWVVLLAAPFALAVLATELAGSGSLFMALAKAGAAAGGIMVLGGLAVRLWAGATVTEAQLPGGLGLAFERSEHEVERLDRELAKFGSRTEGRLRRLEQAVFGSNGSSGDGPGVR
jgi:membrane protein implicated in regulation of membrane protease activity